MVRKIVEKIPDKQLHQDLEKFRARAIELGATDARIITTDMVLIDERVRAKCLYPKCSFYGTNANCPPRSLDLDMTRKIVNNYQYAIFTRWVVPSEEVAGTEARDERLSIPSRRKNHEMISRVESEAFFSGYHLALGFADGPCKSIFCPDIECSAVVPGQACRHSLRARSAMEAVGMNAFTMAARAGWDIYPIGASISPSDVPHGNMLGLVLIY
jgi:predicted metal-binding protein